MAKKTVDELNAEVEALRAKAEATKDLEGVSEKYLQTELEIAKAVAERAKASGAYQLAAKLFEQKISEATDALKEYQEAVKAAEGVSKNFDSALKNSIKSLTGVTDASDTLVGSFAKLYTETGDISKVFDKAKDTFKETFNSLDVGVSIGRKFIESSVLVATEVNKQTAAFNAQTGAGGKYNAQLEALEKSNRNLGISLAEHASARQSLMDNMAGFGAMQLEEQSRLIELSAQYTKIGVATADFTSILNIGTNALGKTNEEMTDIIEQTRKFAQGIGISAAKAVNDLNRSLDKLIAYGDDATEMFQRLQMQSQQTGLEVDNLISIADRFMTFEDAATAAGRLNAQLGGQFFGTMEMLSAQQQGKDSFINYLRSNLQGAIVDFTSLTMYEQEAIARAGNMEVAELSRLMSTNDAIVENTDQQTDFNKALATSRSMFEEIGIFAKQLAVSLQGPMNIIKEMFSIINSVLGALPAGAKTAILGMLSMGGIMGGMKAVLSRAPRAAGGALMTYETNPSAGGTQFMGGGGGKGGKVGFWGGMKNFMKSPMGLGMMAMGAGSLISSKAEEGSGLQKAGDFLGGAGSGAMTGAMLGSVVPVVGPVAGAIVGGLIGGVSSLFHEGGQVGKDGEEVSTVLQKGEFVTKKSAVKAIGPENMATMNETGRVPSGSDPALAAAINNLSSKMDALIAKIAPGDFIMEVDKREFGRIINGHFGTAGSSPAAGVK